MQHGRGQRQLLLNATRQRGDHGGEGAVESYQVEEFPSAPQGVGRRELAQAGREIQVLPHRQVVVERELLRHVADFSFYALAAVGEIQAAHRRGTRGGQQQAAEHPDGGGLAGAVGPEKTEDLPPLNAERDVVHCGKIAELDGEPPDLQGGAGVHTAPPFMKISSKLAAPRSRSRARGSPAASSRPESSKFTRAQRSASSM